MAQGRLSSAPTYADARRTHQQPADWTTLDQYAHGFVKHSNLLPQLPPGNEHGLNDRRYIRTVSEQGFDLPIEWQTAHRARQQAKCLLHPPNVVEQPRCHADELSAGAEQGAR